MYVLSGRLSQAGQHDEAELWRRRACQAGHPFALQDAIADIEERGGGAEEIEQLLRGPAEAGDIWSMKELADLPDREERGAEADKWLTTMADQGNFGALSVLAARFREADRLAEAEQVWRRIIESGNDLAIYNPIVRLQQDDLSEMQRYGIEPGGATANPW
jgi:hypothetical protein